MVIFSHNDISQIPQDKECIFLAGSMAAKSEVNWRQTISTNLQEKYHFIDPTNPNHDVLNDAQMREHIKWEFDGMKRADYIIMNFLRDSLSPISLVELGMNINNEKLIVICPKEFYKWRYIDTLCKEHNTPIFNQLEEILNGEIDTIINDKY